MHISLLWALLSSIPSPRASARMGQTRSWQRNLRVAVLTDSLLLSLLIIKTLRAETESTAIWRELHKLPHSDRPISLKASVFLLFFDPTHTVPQCYASPCKLPAKVSSHRSRVLPFTTS